MNSPSETPTYHDLFITTHNIPRTSIFNLPFNLSVTCTRCGGWELVDSGKIIAGEYGGDKWLVLDVAGIVIVDGRLRASSEDKK